MAFAELLEKGMKYQLTSSAAAVSAITVYHNVNHARRQPRQCLNADTDWLVE